MKKKIWFKQKRYGYGLTPVSWEGWLMTLALVTVILGIGYFNGLFGPEEPAPKDIALFVIEVLTISFLMVGRMANYAEGEMKWRWGSKD